MDEPFLTIKDLPELAAKEFVVDEKENTNKEKLIKFCEKLREIEAELQKINREVTLGYGPIYDNNKNNVIGIELSLSNEYGEIKNLNGN